MFFVPVANIIIADKLAVCASDESVQIMQNSVYPKIQQQTNLNLTRTKIKHNYGTLHHTA